MSLAVWEWKRNALPWQWWRVKWRAPAAGRIGFDTGMHCMLCMHPVQSWVVPLQHASVASTAQTRRYCRRWTPDTFPPPVAEHRMHKLTGWRMQEWLSTGNRLHGCGLRKLLQVAQDVIHKRDEYGTSVVFFRWRCSTLALLRCLPPPVRRGCTSSVSDRLARAHDCQRTSRRRLHASATALRWRHWRKLLRSTTGSTRNRSIWTLCNSWDKLCVTLRTSFSSLHMQTQ